MSILQFLSSSFSLSTTATFLSPTPPKKSDASKLLLPIRMGGGPRTFPGGVNKWQWKRMQAKKSKQLLKARLLRERQIYEMRKRAELKASIAELEKPWELVEKAPVLFSIKADEQVKALADRFQKPGGFDMWSHCDGPQILDNRSNRDPFSDSSRFFPKGVVHSVKPYGWYDDVDNDGGVISFDDLITRDGGGARSRNRKADVLLKANEKEGCIDVEGTVIENGRTDMNDNGRRTSRNMNRRNRGNIHLGNKNPKYLMDRDGLNGQNNSYSSDSDVILKKKFKSREKVVDTDGLNGQNSSYSSDSDVILKKKFKNREKVVTLRPTSDLHVTEGSNRRRSYNWKDN